MRRLRTGPAALAAAVAANTTVWALFPPGPADRPDFARQALAEFLAATAVLLFTACLLLATRARFIERAFGGLDKVYRAHRQAGAVGFALLGAHVAIVPWTLSSPGGSPSGLIAFTGLTVLVLLSLGPRLPAMRRIVTLGYQRWRWSHRFIGLFFIFSFAHAMLVDEVVRFSTPAFAILFGLYVVGIAAYLYLLILARFVRPRYLYSVDAVRRLDETTTEVSLLPRKRRRLAFKAGQFVFVNFRCRGLREPHPFTVSCAPGEAALRLSIKASGDYTGRIHAMLEPGRKAVIEGAYGMLDYRSGASEQIWVAGGIGVTPFLSWLGDHDPDYIRRVDFFYAVSTEAEALYWDEIRSAADSHPNLRVHLHLSSQAGRLTAERIRDVAGQTRHRSVYLCGPVPMVNALTRGFRGQGVPPRRIHFEEFSFR